MVLHWVAGYSLGISWYLIEEEDWFLHFFRVEDFGSFRFPISLSQRKINPILLKCACSFDLPPSFFLIVFSFRGINLIPAASVSITDAPSLTHTHTTESGWKLVFRRVWLKSVNFFMGKSVNFTTRRSKHVQCSNQNTSKTSRRKRQAL